VCDHRTDPSGSQAVPKALDRLLGQRRSPPLGRILGEQLECPASQVTAPFQGAVESPGDGGMYAD